MDGVMTNPVIFKFKLYIAKNTQNSAEAMTNLLGICRRYLVGRHEIEVIDVQRDQQRALADGINMTPSLVKFAPAPFRKIVGTLAHTKRVLVALDLQELPTEPDPVH
jgi:circadian clock protein KaiB